MKKRSIVVLPFLYAVILSSCSQGTTAFQPKGTEQALACAEMFKNNPCSREGKCLQEIQYDLELVGLKVDQVISVLGKPDSISPGFTPGIKIPHYIYFISNCTDGKPDSKKRKSVGWFFVEFSNDTVIKRGIVAY